MFSCIASNHTKTGSCSLKYDGIAAHALLCASRGNIRATQAAAKLLNSRKGQAASFLAKLPTEVDISDVQSMFLKAPTIEEEDEMRTGMAMDHMVYDPVRVNGRSMIEELLVRFKDRGKLSAEDDYSVPISLESTFSDLSDRACYASNEASTPEGESTIGEASKSVFALFQLGKQYFVYFCDICCNVILIFALLDVIKMLYQDLCWSYRRRMAVFCAIGSWPGLRSRVKARYSKRPSSERRIPSFQFTIRFRQISFVISFIKATVIMDYPRLVLSSSWLAQLRFHAFAKSLTLANPCLLQVQRVW